MTRQGMAEKGQGDSTLVPLGWVAYYSDASEIAFFATELEALRYAVHNSMSQVEPVYNGSIVNIGR